MRALQFLFAWVVTLCVFSLTSLAILGVWAWNNPAFPAEKCVVQRAQFNRLMVASGHPLLIEFPEDLSRRFIIGWNKVVRKPAIDATADAVIVYDNENSPTFRIVVLKQGCLVDNYDIPAQGFWAVIKSMDDQKRWEI
jgi:hypothetical protein